jgi:hypothetical protein
MSFSGVSWRREMCRFATMEPVVPAILSPTSDADIMSTAFPANSQNLTVGDFFPAGQPAMVVFCPHPERIKDARIAVQESWRIQSQAEHAAVKTELELTKNEISATKIRLDF